MITSRTFFAVIALIAVLITSAPTRARAANQPLPVYVDALQGGWQNWSWANVNLSATNVVHSGSDSIAVTMTAWSGLYLHLSAFDSTPYDSLTFWINGGPTGGQRLLLQATLSGQAQAGYTLPVIAANTWTQITVPLSTLGVAQRPDLDGFWIQDQTGGNQPTFYVDDISFTPSNIIPPPPPPVTVTIDAAANRHAISPLIYGVAYASPSQLTDLNAPLNRMGGNNTSRYNWQLNADNKAADWFFESIGDDSAVAGERGDTFIGQSKGAGAEPLMTIPMLPWVAKIGPNREKLASYAVSKYGAQQSTDYWMPDAGNGVLASGTTITGNNPADANTPSDVNFQGGWISHIVSKWGMSANGGLKYYIMDNEPSIWHATHRDVHPVGATMDEIKSDIVTYASKVKSLDPNAQVVGPEEWGWAGYFYSGYDQQYGAAHGWSGYPDKAAHGGADYAPWLLQQLAAAEKAGGKRLLDVFSLHIYPQGGEFSDDTSSSMELRRNRSTRELWDPNYVSETWINDKVQLIPRMKLWVASNYPGTKTAITEYNWGAEASINGATTQADILGIFGREGLDMATRWTTPDASTPTYLAMKLYRNYDGGKSGFGDVSVSDTVPNPDNVSSFASVRTSDGALTAVVINKTLSGVTPVTMSIANFTGIASAQVWQLTASNQIARLADVAVAAGQIKANLPAQSVTLFVLPAASAPAPVLTAISPTAVAAGAASYTLTVTGSAFVSGAKVTWNGSALTTTFVSSAKLTASVSASAVAKSGKVKVAVVQSSGTSASATEVVGDVYPPVTTQTLASSAVGTNGWYRAPVQVTLTTTDPDGAADIASVAYSLDSAASVAYSAPFTISSEAAHTVTGKSVDKAGNSSTWSFAVKIDSKPPTTTLSATGGTVTLTAVDAVSGVALTRYSIDGGIDYAYSAPFTLAKGTHKVSFASVDRAGNTEARTVVSVTY